jgi:hypothetical protein
MAQQNHTTKTHLPFITLVPLLFSLSSPSLWSFHDHRGNTPQAIQANDHLKRTTYDAFEKLLVTDKPTPWHYSSPSESVSSINASGPAENSAIETTIRDAGYYPLAVIATGSAMPTLLLRIPSSIE